MPEERKRNSVGVFSAGRLPFKSARKTVEPAAQRRKKKRGRNDTLSSREKKITLDADLKGGEKWWCPSSSDCIRKKRGAVSSREGRRGGDTDARFRWEEKKKPSAGGPFEQRREHKGSEECSSMEQRKGEGPSKEKRSCVPSRRGGEEERRSSSISAKLARRKTGPCSGKKGRKTKDQEDSSSKERRN